MDAETKKLVIKILQATWQAVGADMIMALAGEGEEEEMTASQVREVVADYPTLYSVVASPDHVYECKMNEREFHDMWWDLKWEERQELLTEAFPDGTTYGM